MMAQVDSAIAAKSAEGTLEGAVFGWQHVDTIADFFYHSKYMWVGDGVRTQADPIIRSLRDHRLRSRFSSFGFLFKFSV